LGGTIGIYHRDDAPVEPGLLRSLTAFLAYRGPDDTKTSVEGPVGLGYTALRTDALGRDERQPSHLNGLWITADVRLDARAELIDKLGMVWRLANSEQSAQPGNLIERSMSDAMLILHSYAAWGLRCVEHLRGDFAFGIWDSVTKTLFCARDHFGIKPFYYADLASVFLFSNTLNCLRRHPAVTADLNEAAIGDFLLFGLNRNKATTSFRDIQRLPPAHSLLVSRHRLELKCYWQPPTEGRIRYARTSDYVEHFDELLRCAVADRSNTDRVGILLSGGLDSGAVAITAKELSAKQGGQPELRSFTVGYDSLFLDDEGPYARTMAKHLGISNAYLRLDHVKFFDKWEDPLYRFPEPIDDPLSARLFEQFRLIASECRVLLSGEGPDNLMYFEMWPYIQELIRTGDWARMARETAEFLLVRPFPWRGIASRVGAAFGIANRETKFPSWIAPDFVRRAGLEARWSECDSLEKPAESHLTRPKAHASLLLPHWTNMFELQDPGSTRYPVEVRYPFLDLRVVNYLLAIPTFPWLYKKQLLRNAMVGRMPESLRLRPKKTLSADPVALASREKEAPNGAPHSFGRQTQEFVNPLALRNIYDTLEFGQARPYCLDRWLKEHELTSVSHGDGYG
jgi:asparagine synthase (glutamine-hydrolysing)